MRNTVRDKLIDDVIEAYVDWRQGCLEVEFAYRRWSIARFTDPARAFAEYRAAVNGEELASMDYADTLRRAAVLLVRERRRRFRTARRDGTGRRPSRARRRKERPRAGATRGRGSARSAGPRRSRQRPSA